MTLEQKTKLFNKYVSGKKDWYDENRYRIVSNHQESKKQIDEWFVSYLFDIPSIDNDDIENDNEVFLEGFIYFVSLNDKKKIKLKVEFRFVWKEDYWRMVEWYDIDEDYHIIAIEW